MGTPNISDVVLCVNKFKAPKDKPRSAVYYLKNVDLNTFEPSDVLDAKMQKVEGSDVKGRVRDVKGSDGQVVKNFDWVTWESWDGSYVTPPKPPLQIVIFPRDEGKRIGGVAYIEDDAAKSIPKIFQIYPGKQRSESKSERSGQVGFPLWKDGVVQYVCVYYGTLVNKPIRSLLTDSWETKFDKDDFDAAKKEGNLEKPPEVVPWTRFETVAAMLRAAMLQGGNVGSGPELEKMKRELERVSTDVKNKNEELERVRTDVKDKNEELERVRTDVKNKNEELERVRTDVKNKNEELERVTKESQTTKKQLETRKEELRKRIDEWKKTIDNLKAAAKAVVGAINDLGNYDNIFDQGEEPADQSSWD